MLNFNNDHSIQERVDALTVHLIGKAMDNAGPSGAASLVTSGRHDLLAGCRAMAEAIVAPKDQGPTTKERTALAKGLELAFNITKGVALGGKDTGVRFDAREGARGRWHFDVNGTSVSNAESLDDALDGFCAYLAAQPRCVAISDGKGGTVRVDADGIHINSSRRIFVKGKPGVAVGSITYEIE
jgi:hypothetical protein